MFVTVNVKFKDSFLPMKIDLEDEFYFKNFNMWIKEDNKAYKSVYIYFEKKTRVFSHVLLKITKLDVSKVVDHISKDSLDNRKQNLRIVSKNINAQNRTKSKNCSSKYMGVSWCDSKHKWAAHATFNGKLSYLGCFEIEIEAAKVYDRFIIFYYQTFDAGLNNCLTEDEKELALQTEPILSIKKKSSDLPKGINKVANRFNVTYCENLQPHTSYFDTIEEATSFLSKQKQRIAQEKENLLKHQPVSRNKDNMPIIITNKRRGIQHEILVDEILYPQLIRYSWTFNQHKQDAVTKINDKQIAISEYVLQLSNAIKNPGDTVDHKFNDHHDCRIASLRFLDKSGQCQNKLKQKHTASKFFGVSRNKNLWCVRIMKNYAECFRGSFKTEIEAAQAYNKEIVKYYDDPKLNVIMKDIENTVTDSAQPELKKQRTN